MTLSLLRLSNKNKFFCVKLNLILAESSHSRIRVVAVCQNHQPRIFQHQEVKEGELLLNGTVVSQTLSSSPAGSLGRTQGLPESGEP